MGETVHLTVKENVHGRFYRTNHNEYRDSRLSYKTQRPFRVGNRRSVSIIH